MVSEYLKNTRSLNELRALVDKHHRASAAIAETVFNQEVSAAFSSITETTQISSARIQADSQVASSKIASDSEIASISLMASAEITMLNIQSQRVASIEEGERPSSMTMEICRAAKTEITNSAQEFVDQIKTQAQTAISRITDVGLQAIQEIQEFRSEIQKRMRAEDDNSIDLLKSAFNKASDKDDETGQNYFVEAAFKEEKKIQVELVKMIKELDDHIAKSIKNINWVTDNAILEMKKTVNAATERIFKIRDAAVETIEHIMALNSAK